MILHERFDAEEVLKTIEREKVTYVGAVPTMCERMLHVLESTKYDTSTLRCLAITGGKVHPAVLEALKKYITPNIYRTYASTDSGQMAISKPADMEAKPNAAGRPVWCVDLRIVDDDNNPVKVGDVGEIICQSPLAVARLLQKSRSDQCLVSRRLVLHRRSWLFRRGRVPVRRRPKEGHGEERRYQHLSVGDRKRHLQSSGDFGSRRYRRAGRAVGRGGQSGGGRQSRTLNLRAEDLLGFCKERLSAYKVPKSVEFRSSLPHTEVGKVNKVKLREMILEKPCQPPTNSENERRFFHEVLGRISALFSVSERSFLSPCFRGGEGVLPRKEYNLPHQLRCRRTDGYRRQNRRAPSRQTYSRKSSGRGARTWPARAASRESIISARRRKPDALTLGYFTGPYNHHMMKARPCGPISCKLPFIASVGSVTVCYIRSDVAPGIKKPTDIAKAERFKAGGPVFRQQQRSTFPPRLRHSWAEIRLRHRLQQQQRRAAGRTAQRNSIS